MDSIWAQLLKSEGNKPYFQKLMEFIHDEYRGKKVYPPKDLIYNALELTAYKDIKAVIVGQDPYFNPGEAHGLAFSVQEGCKIPPSLRNIYREIEDDLGIEPGSGDLTHWAKQGVLLINRVLTVREGKPNSHKDSGWLVFTEEIIKYISEREDPVVFFLWGAEARKLKRLIDGRHLVLESAHPSPLSAYRGFLGSKPFSKCNSFLEEMGSGGIDWRS